MAYTPTLWINNQAPALSATNLNKLTDEIESQAATQSIGHSLPTWANGSAPALTDGAPLNEMERVVEEISLSLGLDYTPTSWSSGWIPARNATRFNALEQQVAACAAVLDNTAGIIWQADGSTGTDPAYIIEQEWSAISDDSAGGSAEITAPWSHPDIYLTASTGDVLPGKRSYFVHVPAGEGRHELKMAHPIRSGFDSRLFHEGEETWISWAVKIADYVHPPSGQWMVNQFRHITEGGLPSGGSPHGLAMRSPANWQWVSDASIYTNAVNTYDMGVPIVRGGVLKVTFHAKWSSNPATGFMQVFLNNGSGWTEGFPLRYQATLLFDSTTGQSGRNHMRFGAYRANSAGTIDDAPADSYMAGLTCASTRSAAENGAFS